MGVFMALHSRTGPSQGVLHSFVTDIHTQYPMYVCNGDHAVTGVSMVLHSSTSLSCYVRSCEEKLGLAGQTAEALVFPKGYM